MRSPRTGILFGFGFTTLVLLACNGGAGPLFTLDGWDDHPGDFEKPTNSIEKAINSNDTPQSTGENPGTQGGCYVAAGKYALHYTLDPSSSQQCKQQKDDTITIKTSGDPTQPGDVSQQVDPSCTVTSNRGTCTLSAVCNETSQNQAVTLTESISFGGGKITGSITTSSGSQTCKYTFTATLVTDQGSEAGTPPPPPPTQPPPPPPPPPPAPPPVDASKG
jgi:hypothetical protein